MTSTLQGQIALVTGAARGIGQAVAVALAEAGARVVVFDPADAEQTLARIASAGGSARAVRGSVADELDVLRVMQSIAATEGRLDLLVNNAGIQIVRPLLETTLADLDAVLAVNLKGTFLTGREAIRLMLRQTPRDHSTVAGRVINLSSELAYLGRAEFSAYAASKGAVLSLTRSWAREFAPRILVNALAPGPTDTAMVSLASLTTEQLQREFDAVPLGRIARPEEIAASVVFLAGPGGSFFTGACISPNGGAVMF